MSEGTLARPHARNDEIDRLRAVAILLVLFTHIGDYVELTASGWPAALFHRLRAMGVGVDLFFVISGYVVSAVIVERIDTLPARDWAGYRRFIQAFYLRRAFRILPMSWLVLAIFAGGFAAIWGAGARLDYALETALSAVAFWANYFLYFNPPTHYSASPFQSYWSLAIEEQFYFVYPIFLFAVRSAWLRRLTLAAGIVLIGAYLRPQFLDDARIAGRSLALFATHFRADAILAGCLLYLCRDTFLPRLRLRLPALLAWLGGIIGIAVLVELRVRALVSPTYGLAGVVVVSTLFVALAAAERGLIFPSRGRTASALRWVGLRSYSLYLINWPLLWWLDGIAPSVRGAGAFSVAAFLLLWLLLSAALTELAFRAVEKPLMRRGAKVAARIETNPVRRRERAPLEPT